MYIFVKLINTGCTIKTQPKQQSRSTAQKKKQEVFNLCNGLLQRSS
jgi:hypothetical protein